MPDIEISNNLNLTTGDLTLINGEKRVIQHIKVALNTFYKDWLLDATKGIDYANGLRNLELLEHDIKKQITEVADVISISDFSLEFNRKDLTINVQARIKTNYGDFDLSEAIEKYQ